MVGEPSNGFSLGKVEIRVRSSVIAIGIMLAASSMAFIIYEWAWGPNFQPPPAAKPLTAKAQLPLPESEIKKTLDEAKAEVDRRYKLASSARWWSRATSWAALILTSVMTIIA